MNQLECERMFQTDDDYISYLFEIRYKDGFKCSRCSNTTYWKNVRGLYICKSCKHEHSVTANTIFH
jgi:ribosomal protein L37AE/L43A